MRIGTNIARGTFKKVEIRPLEVSKIMYDKRLDDVKEKVEMYGFTALVPASNTLIVKELAENPAIAGWVEEYVVEHEAFEITWTENTAEITVNDP